MSTLSQMQPFQWRVPLSDLDYGPQEEEAVLRVLRSGWLSMGPEVGAFEAEMSSLLGSKHCLAVSSGTAALHMAMLGLGIGPGDEVIQPALNFVAAANMTEAVGAEPVFADIISLENPTIDPLSIEALMTPHTKAVVVMHYGGHACEMEEIYELCERRSVAIIEDACHAVGARWTGSATDPTSGRMLGAVGAVGCLSFFSNKNLATGEGGLLATDDDMIAETLRRLRSHGMTTLSWDRYQGHASSYDVVLHGFNYRIDEVHAALGRVQLGKLGENNRRRGELVGSYLDALEPLQDWVVPFCTSSRESAHHLMVALAPDHATRELVVQRLREVGIQSSLHYPCIPDLAAFRTRATGDLAKTREFVSRAITLPLYPTLGLADVDDVVGAIRSAVA